VSTEQDPTRGLGSLTRAVARIAHTEDDEVFRAALGVLLRAYEDADRAANTEKGTDHE